LWIVVSGALTGKQCFDCLELALRINPTNKGTFQLMKKANPKRAYIVAGELKLFDFSLTPNNRSR
jgi:predicted RNA-binding protein with PUA domain